MCDGLRRPLTTSCTFPTLVRITIQRFPWLVQIYTSCSSIIMNNDSFPLKIFTVLMVNYLVYTIFRESITNAIQWASENWGLALESFF